jgi:DNA-binding PadR family transcriptional regulator
VSPSTPRSARTQAPPGLGPAEWAALGLVCEHVTHGFALAKALDQEGELGRIWTVSRPLVYRAVENLKQRGLIEIVADQPSAAGPNRTLLRATRSGRRALRKWLGEPVEHLRDGRVLLLLKVELAQRSSIDTVPLLLAQRDVFERLADAVDRRIGQSGVHPANALIWRSEALHAAVRAIDRMLGAHHPAPVAPDGTAPRS